MYNYEAGSRFSFRSRWVCFVHSLQNISLLADFDLAHWDRHCLCENHFVSCFQQRLLLFLFFQLNLPIFLLKENVNLLEFKFLFLHLFFKLPRLCPQFYSLLWRHPCNFDGTLFHSNLGSLFQGTFSQFSILKNEISDFKTQDKKVFHSSKRQRCSHVVSYGCIWMLVHQGCCGFRYGIIHFKTQTNSKNIVAIYFGSRSQSRLLD